MREENIDEKTQTLSRHDNNKLSLSKRRTRKNGRYACIVGRNKKGKYDIYMSEVTIVEVGACKEPKRSILFDYLNEIEYTHINIDNTIDSIALKFIEFGILTPKSIDDCTHIAAAIVADCDIIVSWNFKHIVNVKTVKGIKAVSALGGYDDVLIMTPSFLVGGDQSDT